MPHIIIEHSSNFYDNDICNLGKNIVNKMSQLAGNFQLKQCKFRSISYNNYFIGDRGNNCSFLHITIKIMSGRSDEIKTNLSEEVKKIMLEFVEKTDIIKTIIKPLDMTIDIVDMKKEFYQKVVLNLLD